MDIKLTDYEKGMLGGREGKFKQKAMEVIVRYAQILGAQELCEVTKAHIFCGAHNYLEVFKTKDIDLLLSEMWFCSSEKLTMDKMACFCQSCAGPLDPDNYEKCYATREEYEKNEEILKRCLAAGVNLIGTCAPYLIGFIPLMGEHYVTSESSAVLMLNSLWGACGNADGIETGFCSAACGRTPLWGNHIMSNRKGTHIFDIKCKTETVFDWNLLGYSIGRKLPTHSTPIITGNFTRPDMIKLKSSYATMATSSGAEMCHIVGITPEAVTLEQALGGKNPQDVITITDRDLEESLSIVSSSGRHSIEFISLGCPHYSIEEIRLVASYLDGKDVSSSVTLQIWTAYPIKAIADKCGYTKKIENAGGQLLTSTCPAVHERIAPKLTAMAFDSAKQAHSLRNTLGSGTKIKIFVGSDIDCLKSAISGMWEGR